MLDIQLIKSQFPQSVVNLGDTITYTVAILNKGDIPINNVLLLDTIPICTTFVADSLKLDGVTLTGVMPAPPVGAPLGSVMASSVRTVTFNVVLHITPCECIKKTGVNYIENDATIMFNYTTDPNHPNNNLGSAFSNRTRLPISCLSINKFADKDSVSSDEILTYTIVVKNNDTTPLNNVSIHDTIPNCTEFIQNSLIINGGSYTGTPSNINLGNMAPGQTFTITFKIIPKNCICTTTIANSCYGSYNTSSGIISTSQSNIVLTNITCTTIPVISFRNSVSLNKQIQHCGLTSQSIQLESQIKPFSYKYLTREGACSKPPRDTLNGDSVGFTFVFGNYGDLNYTAVTGVPTVEDTLYLEEPIVFRLNYLSICPNFRVLNKNTNTVVTPCDKFYGGTTYKLQVQKLVNGTYTPYFDLPCNSTYCISMLFTIGVPDCPKCP